MIHVVNSNIGYQSVIWCKMYAASYGIGPVVIITVIYECMGVQSALLNLPVNRVQC